MKRMFPLKFLGSETFLALWCFLSIASGEYKPILNWDVCSPSRIIVTLSGAAAGGIIYIKGYGAACKQTTTSVPTVHEFDFNACGINTAETYFTIIVQKNPLYQTGDDLQESLICIYDLSDISVGNGLNVGDDEDDAGINKTVKPTAQMKLYRNGLDVGGNSVKLTDLVTMTIQVDDEFIADFDVKARSCTANYIDIITGYCATDAELFPDFSHVTRGVLTATFGAFRTTDLASGLVEMTFSCTLQVCLDACAVSTCNSGNEGWGRRKRAVDDDPAYDVNVGASLSVGTRVEVEKKGSVEKEELCLNTIAFVVALSLLIGVVVTSMGLTSYTTSKLVQKSNLVRKYKERDETEAAWKPSQNNCQTEQRRTSSVSIITTSNMTATSTTKTGEKDESNYKTDDWFSERRNSLQKQASVTTIFSPQSVNHSSKETSPHSQSHSISDGKSNSTSNKLKPIMEAEDDIYENQSKYRTGRGQGRKPVRNLEELKATKDKLVQYQKLLERLGVAHLMQNTQ